MSKNKLLILFSVVLLLGVGVLFSSEKSSAVRKSVSILSHVNGENVSKIVISKAGKEQILEVVNDTWVLPTSDNYPANVSKIRALLLKLLDLKSSQSLNPSSQGLKKLGLDDEGVKSIFSKVSFFDKAEKLLGSIFIGKQRISNAQQGSSSPGSSSAGQYVKTTESDLAYLISSPISVVVDSEEWIESNLLNILSKNVFKVEQFDDEKGSENVFTLSRQKLASFYLNSNLILDKKIPNSKQLNDSIVSQIASGLENLRFSKVFLRENKKEFKINKKTKYYLISGLIYTVFSAESKDDSIAAFFTVEYDESLVEQLKSLESELRSEEMLKGFTKEEVEKIKNAKPLVFSTADEAKVLSAKYSKWIYEFPAFQGKKFRKDFSELYKDKE